MYFSHLNFRCVYSGIHNPTIQKMSASVCKSQKGNTDKKRSQTYLHHFLIPCNSSRIFLFKNIYFLFYLSLCLLVCKIICVPQNSLQRPSHVLKLKMVVSYPDVRTQTQGPLPVQKVLLTTKLPLQPFSLLLSLWFTTIGSALSLWVPTLPFLPKLTSHLLM